MYHDSGVSTGSVQTGVQVSGNEHGFWHDHWIFRKYASDEDYKAGRFYEENVVDHKNALLYVGINQMWQLITGASAVHFDNASTTIGVGDSETATDPATHTDLLAVSNKTYKGMQATYPQSGSNQKAVFQAVFGATDANYNWREFVVKSTVCLNRLVSNQGTKASGQTWTVTLEISLS